MKFMKLGSKPDLFQTDGDNLRYVATELATDIVINVGDVKFFLHKFPLLSRSARLKKLVAIASEETNAEIQIDDIPGGPAAFEICAKFCYGMTVTLNAYNVIAARCAAEYLEMYETADKGNLIYKIEVFLNSSIFRTWKDSIIVFQTTKSLLPWSEELKVVNHCLDSIASKASIDPSKVEWSYTYSRRKISSEIGNDGHYNNVTKKHMVPSDWWVEDLCELPVDLYKRVISTIRTKSQVSAEVIGESLKAYANRRLSGFSKGKVQVSGDDMRSRAVVETLISLLPEEKTSVPCAFLFQLLQASMVLDCGETDRREVMRKISQQLDEATMADLLIRAPHAEKMVYNIDIVKDLVEEFVMQGRSTQNKCPEDVFEEVKGFGFISDASKAKVAKLVDMYLAEVARDPNVPVSKFADLAELVSGFSRPSHDGLYRAIDMYLKEHTGISKSERKRICKLMDCKKLSADACMHAVQNERLPLRVVVQVLFFEQMRAAATSSGGGSTPDLQRSLRTLLPPAGSHGSSRSATTNTDDDFDSMPTTEELKALKGELASLKLRDRSDLNESKLDTERAVANKVKGLVVSRRMFSKLWSRKERHSENSGSETSESLCSTNADDTKSTPSRSRRHSRSIHV